MATRQSYRHLDAVLILDKPCGISSNRALQKARHLFQARKAGHCGSLDPLASGVLPVCFGQATKFSSYLLGANKTYRAHCRLGQTTTTGDAEGEILQTRPVDIDPEQVVQVLASFVGDISQIPPMYSALKYEGRRLYELARDGQTVERAARQVTVHNLDLVSLKDGILEIMVCCSKGTYIRTLAEDIGEKLGCGAHLEQLRRTRVEPFALDSALELDALEALASDSLQALDRNLLPVSHALQQFPVLNLDARQSLEIRQGKRIELESPGSAGLVRLVGPEGDFLGLGKRSDQGELSAKRLMNTAS